MRYGSCKDKKGAKYSTSSCFWRLWHSRETRVKMKTILTRSLARMAALVSIKLFYFALEISVQKGDQTSNEKNANMRRWRLLLLMIKIPFVYCQLNMEDLSVTGCLHTFVTECVLFSNSGEEKIYFFYCSRILIKVFDRRTNIKHESFQGYLKRSHCQGVWSAAANFILHLTALYKVNKFSNLKVNDSHGQGSFSSRIVCRTYFRFVSLLIWKV